MLPRGDLFLDRLVEYALKTKILAQKTDCRRDCLKLGLPDLRGFSPHLRIVNLFADSPFEWQKINSGDFLKTPEFQWLAHDLLHIIFYDFASINLGKDLWDNKNRFYECHLASELFAVLALDYHYLVNTSVQGLAVDLKARDWKGFQSIKSDLPAMTSFDFCRDLAQLYFNGSGNLTTRITGSSKDKINIQFSNWLGHELRYSEKQRHYVLAWREDLDCKKPTRRQVHLTDTFIAEPLWELLHLFHGATETEWKNYLKISLAFKKPKNYFERLPKFKKETKAYDFRFTALNSLPKKSVVALLESAKKPSSSALFLFWQIISRSSMNLFSKSERQAIQGLALTSQTNAVTAHLWEPVRQLSLDKVNQMHWNPSPLAKSTFYLP